MGNPTSTGVTPLPSRDPIAGLSSILDLFSGKVTTNTVSPETTTETTKTNLTQDQLNAQMDMAMAPLNQASHGAGLSTYGDTTLALGRGQIAADIMAKNAGTTRTTTTSGRVATSATPGPLDSSRIGGTVGNLITAQIGAPLLKKVTKPLTDSMNGIMDSVFPTTGATGDIAGGSDGISGLLQLNDNFSQAAGPDVAGSLAASEVTDTAGSGVADAISSGASDAWTGLKDLFGFADGGYIDTHVANSNLTAQSSVAATASASGEVSPIQPLVNSGKNTRNILAGNEAMVGSSTGDGSSAVAGPAGSGFSMGEIGLTALSLASPMAAAVLGLVTNTQTIQSQLAHQIYNSIASTGPNGSDALSGFLAMNDNFSQSPGPEAATAPTSSDGEAAGNGPSSGEGVASEATGGSISGPGTGTSDSIPAKLSDGEYVIDAKTVQALGADFFQAIQAHFNPTAIAGQRAKGRI